MMKKKYIFIAIAAICIPMSSGCILRDQPIVRPPVVNKSYYPEEYTIFGTGTQAEVAAALKRITDEPLPKKETDQYGITPLMIAASMNCDPAVIDMIGKAGWKTKEESSWKHTALFYATAYNTEPEITKALTGYGGLNDKDFIGYTPLYWAIQCNPNLEIARMLIRLHADVRVNDFLSIAASRTEAPWCIDVGEFVKLPSCPYDKTSMDFYQQRAALVRELLAAGAKPNSTILTRVAFRRDDENLEIFKILLASGANIGEALYESGNSLEKTRLLLDAGAKVTASKNRCAPLYIAMQSRSNPDVGVLLVKAGANVNDECIGGDTPLLALAGEWRKLPDDNQVLGRGDKTADEQAKALLRLTTALIDAGADVNAANDRGETALDLVQDSKRPELREFLLKAGAKAGSGHATKN